MRTVAMVLFFGMLVSGCFSGDDFFRTVVVSANDSVRFENQKNYVVGDTLFFEVAFSRYLEEEGFSTLLDIYETTDSEVFSSSFGLLRFSDFSNNYEFVNIDPEFLLGSNTESSGFFGNEITVALDDSQERYFSNFGLILAEPGDYRLDFDFLSFTPPFNPSQVRLQVENRITTDSNLDTDFTVTEE